jgi:UrcA family protein
MSARPLLILLTAALASTAQASAERERVLSVPVPLADLDLARERDAERLLERLQTAAWRACGGDPRRHPSYEVMPRYVREVFAECRDDAVAQAVAEVASPALSAVHARRSAVD